MGVIVFAGVFLAEDESSDSSPFVLRTEVNKKSFDLVLEEDYEDNQTDVHEFVENRTRQFHVEYS
jgi:hypothetical protein